MSKTDQRPARGRGGSTAATERGNVSLTPEERHEYISVAAYYLSECHGFRPECHEDDWLAAEQEIDAQYA